MESEKLKEIYKELKSFCKENNIETGKSGYLMGLFTKYHRALSQHDVIKGFDIDKMKTIVPYYIVDMGEIHCNELRFIIETFLSQNHDFKAKVDELKNLI